MDHKGAITRPPEKKKYTGQLFFHKQLIKETSKPRAGPRTLEYGGI